MYIFPDEIKKSYECLRISLMIMGPSASGEFEPLVISDGLLELGDVSRKDLYGYYANRIKEGLFVRLHPDEEEKLKAISLSFLDKKTEYDITFRVRLDDGYHLIHAIGYWQTMEDGTDLAFMVYNDVQKHEKSLSDISNKYKLFQMKSIILCMNWIFICLKMYVKRLRSVMMRDFLFYQFSSISQDRILTI